MKKNEKCKIDKATIIKFLLILFIAAFCTQATLQNDTYYTIKVGEKIASEGYFTEESFTYHENLKYVNPHWIFDLIIYYIYNMSGYLGIYIYVIITSIITTYLADYLLKILGSNRLNRIIFSVIFATFYSMYNASRAQSVSFMLFILEMIFLELYFKTNKKRFLALLAIIPVAIANVHVAVIPVYYVLFMPFLVQIINFNYKRIETKQITKKQLIELVATMILATVFFVIFTPGGKDYLTYTLKMNTYSYIGTVIEHKPPVLFSETGMILFLITLVEVGVLSLTTKKISTKELSLHLGLLIMALKSVRLLMFVITIGLPYFYSYYLKNVNNEKRKLKITLTKNEKKVYLAFAVLILTGFLAISKSKMQFVNEEKYPVEATNYIKDNIDYNALRIFNEYEIGPYLLMNDIPVFIDSRQDLYTKKFNDVRVYEDYVDAFTEPYKYDEIMEEYKIDYAIVKIGNGTIATYFKKTKDFEEIYKDKYFKIYQKKGLNIEKK